jgi:DUF1680 family protein
MTAEWGVYVDEKSIDINYYGPSIWYCKLPDETNLTLTQTTCYPISPNVLIMVSLFSAKEFTLRLRIPSWSEDTTITIDGASAKAKPGTYHEIKKVWSGSEQIRIEFDFSFHTWHGKNAFEGRTSLYRGPILLAFDQRYNKIEYTDMQTFDASGLKCKSVTESFLPPWLLLEEADTGYVLCDFASAGSTGTNYTSWLPRINNQRMSCWTPTYVKKQT